MSAKKQKRKPAASNANCSRASGSPSFVTEIVTSDQPIVIHGSAFGYGGKAVYTRLTGARPQEMTVVIDGRLMLSIHIDDDGNIHLTNCCGMFEHLFGAVLKLTNTRPWKANGPRDPRGDNPTK